DATMEDAIVAGLDDVAHLISNGSPMIGTDLESCSAEFLRHFDAADLVVSKGQANFETLNETSAPLFFILKAKCDEVARELGVSTGDVVAEFNRL
ncbi:MAG: ARMT1-like domain-containing protein, partial [Anaerolineae bacterium]|nr:ARMT1-like domain-containing protein [Anaerolineae bacterium]